MVYPAYATSATTTASAAIFGTVGRSHEGISRAGFLTTGSGIGADGERRAAASPSVVEKRCSGAFANAVRIAASTCSGTSGRNFRTEGTGDDRCWSMRAIAVGAANGRVPVRISYATHPSAYWSLRPSKFVAALSHCSGLM